MKPSSSDENRNNLETSQPEFQEEWLSAYLDDELTVEQRQQVERHLASAPGAQQTLNELRLIRSLVLQLPAWRGPIANMMPNLEAELGPNSDEADDIEQVSDDLPSDALTNVASKRAERDDGQIRTDDQRRGGGGVTPGLYSWLRPLAIAASPLAVVGVGYVLWSGVGSNRSDLALQNAPGSAAQFDQATAEASESVPENEVNAMAPMVLGGVERMEQDSVAGAPEPMNLNMGNEFSRQAKRMDDPLSVDQSARTLSVDQSTRALDDSPMSSSASPAPASAFPALMDDEQPLVEPQALSFGKNQGDKTPSEPPSAAIDVKQLFVGSDGSWTAEMIEVELRSNPMLLPLQSDERGANLTLQLAQNVTRQDQPLTSATHNAMVVAQIPEASSGKELFNQLVNDYQLQRVTEIDSAPAIDRLPAPGNLPTTSTDSATANSATADRVIGAKSGSAPSQMLLLFLKRSQAEQIVQQSAATAENRQTPQYLWINPPIATETQTNNDERVILLLNSKM